MYKIANIRWQSKYRGLRNTHKEDVTGYLNPLGYLFAFTVLFLVSTPAAAQDLGAPDVHTSLAVQSELYFGEDDTILGYLAPDSKFIVRYAAIEIEGELGEYVEYNLEIGSASCAGPGIGIIRMEASVFFKPFDFLKAGIMQGHIMRGFELHQECMDVLTAEKPRFFRAFAPCHPTGAVIDIDYDFTETMGISAELAYLNGQQKGTLGEEHDMNLGLIFRTPILGLSVGGFYSDIEQDFEYDGEPDKASRNGLGFNYDAFNVHLRGEYYVGKGFYSSYPDVSSEDLEMRAYFVDIGYKWETGNRVIPYIQPYVMYQSWDKARNVEENHKYTYLTAGLTLGLGSPNAKLRVDYEIPVDSPPDTYNEANRLILRFQGDY
ncbi:hypothetical protein KAW48_07260 [candidate division WOR-3 bacterium]|nr:hypothetical protein [candidate division WOR-3 bacterium]